MELSGQVLTPEGLRSGTLAFGERVEGFTPGKAPLRYLLPGFIDLHVHGGAGADAMEGEEAVRQLARFHAAHGTTALLATTVTAPFEDLKKALSGIEAVRAQPGKAEARVLGAHLEGPWISPKKLGAQPPFARPPAFDEVEALLELTRVRVVTLAPEVEGGLELIRFLEARGVKPQIGHTSGTFEDARAALEAGAAGFTHFFNAMTGLHHRAPGVVGAGLLLGRFAEVIADGLHVAPEAARLLFKNVPGAYVVTDAVAAAGMPDGPYPLGRYRVEKRGEGVYLEDGTLAGSTLTLDRALKNLVAWGLALPEAASRLSKLPAAYLGLKDRGELRTGYRADIVVLDENLNVEEVYVAGQRVHPADAR